jgi:hypothetical protein
MNADHASRVRAQIATLAALLAGRNLPTSDAYDGPEPDPYDGWTERSLDALADRRAAQEFYGGQS